MNYIVSHCRKDVSVLAEVYERIKPLVLDHPNRGLLDGRGGCSVCGAKSVQKRGVYVTRTRKYQRLPMHIMRRMVERHETSRTGPARRPLMGRVEKHASIVALAAALVGAIAVYAVALSIPAIRLKDFRPSQGIEPVVERGIIQIEPDTHNRAFCIIINSDGYVTQSCKDIEGTAQRKYTEAAFPLPAGDYLITAFLYRDDGKIVPSNPIEVHVLSKTGGPSGGTDENRLVRRGR
jgi:hypothetical protein